MSGISSLILHHLYGVSIDVSINVTFLASSLTFSLGHCQEYLQNIQSAMHLRRRFSFSKLLKDLSGKFTSSDHFAAGNSLSDHDICN